MEIACVIKKVLKLCTVCTFEGRSMLKRCTVCIIWCEVLEISVLYTIISVERSESDVVRDPDEGLGHFSYPPTRK